MLFFIRRRQQCPSSKKKKQPQTPYVRIPRNIYSTVKCKERETMVSCTWLQLARWLSCCRANTMASTKYEVTWEMWGREREKCFGLFSYTRPGKPAGWDTPCPAGRSSYRDLSSAVPCLVLSAISFSICNQAPTPPEPHDTQPKCVGFSVLSTNL